jgi:hypothetical protein
VHAQTINRHNPFTVGSSNIDINLQQTPIQHNTNKQRMAQQYRAESGGSGGGGVMSLRPAGAVDARGNGGMIGATRGVGGSSG